jgi:hypothetical protein
VTSPPEAPLRYACGCTHEWIEWVRSTVHPGEVPEWLRQLQEDRPREGWWHIASRDLRYHVWQNGRWRAAQATLDNCVNPDISRWTFDEW